MFLANALWILHRPQVFGVRPLYTFLDVDSFMEELMMRGAGHDMLPCNLTTLEIVLAAVKTSFVKR